MFKKSHVYIMNKLSTFSMKRQIKQISLVIKTSFVQLVNFDSGYICVFL